MAKNLNQLITSHRQNAVTHQCDVGEGEYENFVTRLKLLERLSEIENTTYSVLDMHRNAYLLKSSKFKKQLGYVNPEDIENDDLELFHRIIHPDDLYFVMETELGDIQKTLFMPVWARAVETKKKNPVLLDITAVEIIDSVDFDFSQMTANLAEINQIAWIARCKRFDEIVNKFLTDYPEGTVVNIGCGLDTSYERTCCKSVHWYDLDLPDVIELKKKFQKETAGRKFISCSFLDTRWFDMITVYEKILFISAGVFVYFDESEIRDFIIKVASRFDYCEMLFDVTSPKGLEIANQVIQKSGLDSRSYFRWALTDKSVIFSWDSRINLINTYHTFRIAGLDMSDGNKNIALISDSLDIQYMLHLSIKKPSN